jgi:isomerase DpgB
MTLSSLAVPAPAAPAGAELLVTVDGAEPLSLETVHALSALCDRCEDAGPDAVAVLVVSGHASASADSPALALVNKWERALRRLERLDVPTVALVSGSCGGTALDALLATDHRIAAPGTRLELSATADGVWPGMALYRLTNQLGLARTRRNVLFGAPIDAERGLELGLFDQVADEPAEAFAALVEALGRATCSGLAVRRQLMLDATTTSFEEALGRHLAACDRALREPARGVRA